MTVPQPIRILTGLGVRLCLGVGLGAASNLICCPLQSGQGKFSDRIETNALVVSRPNEEGQLVLAGSDKGLFLSLSQRGSDEWRFAVGLSKDGIATVYLLGAASETASFLSHDERGASVLKMGHRPRSGVSAIVMGGPPGHGVLGFETVDGDLRALLGIPNGADPVASVMGRSIACLSGRVDDGVSLTIEATKPGARASLSYRGEQGAGLVLSDGEGRARFSMDESGVALSLVNGEPWFEVDTTSGGRITFPGAAEEKK